MLKFAVLVLLLVSIDSAPPDTKPAALQGMVRGLEGVLEGALVNITSEDSRIEEFR